MQTIKLHPGPKNSWQEWEIELIKKEYPLLGIKIKSKLNNKKDSSIRNKAMDLGVKCNHETRINNCSDSAKKRPKHNNHKVKYEFYHNEDMKKDIINMYTIKGISTPEIAKKYNIKSPETIAKFLKKNNVKLILGGVNAKDNIKNIFKNKKVNTQGDLHNWSQTELEFLKNNYWMEEKETIIKTINLPWKYIMKKARKLKLVRNKKYFASRGTIAFNKRDNPSKRPEIRLKRSLQMKQKIKENPEILLNKRLQRHKKTSIEIRVERILKKLNVSYFYDKGIHTITSIKFPDFRIGKLCIECDGTRFHTDKKKETERDREIINSGYEILHFSQNAINNNIEKVERCIVKKLNETNTIKKNQLGFSFSGGD